MSAGEKALLCAIECDCLLAVHTGFLLIVSYSFYSMYIPSMKGANSEIYISPAYAYTQREKEREHGQASCCVYKLAYIYMLWSISKGGSTGPSFSHRVAYYYIYIYFDPSYKGHSMAKKTCERYVGQFVIIGGKKKAERRKSMGDVKVWRKIRRTAAFE